MKLVPSAATKTELMARMIKLYKLTVYRRCQQFAEGIIGQAQDLVDIGSMTSTQYTAFVSSAQTIRNQFKNIVTNATSKTTVDNAEVTVKQMLQDLIDPYLQ